MNLVKFGSHVQHNREFFGFIRGGVPVEWQEPGGETKHALARVIDFRNAGNNRFLAVRELKIQFFPLVAGPFLKVSKIQKNPKNSSRSKASMLKLKIVPALTGM